jgi:peptide-methionine (S)-S-oxide reductase
MTKAIAFTVMGMGALLALVGCAVSAAGAVSPASGVKVGTNPGNIGKVGPYHLKPTGHNQLASFSAGCFWGTEDIFRQVPGVVATAVGYTGGHLDNPTYEDVCTHTTGHAETVLVEFDPSKTSYKKLLNVFWENHDPTTPNQQGPDFGTNYRSAIWCFDKDQLAQAKQSLVEAQSKLKHKIVTEIGTTKPFWIAEDYHQQYDEKHGTHFCPIGHGS